LLASFCFLLSNYFHFSRIYLTVFKQKIEGKMKRAKLLLLALMFLSVSAIGAFAQESNIVRTNLPQAEIDRIVKAFTANETAFRNALNTYVFSRSASISTVGMGGQISGTYRRDSQMAFGENGKRVEKIVFAPMPTLKEITISAADLDNLSGVDQFAIEPSVASQYNFTFVGKEKIDELDLYVFDVTPKGVLDPKKVKQHFFSGRIWVDTTDLMIVKTKGKAVPEQKDERFPVIETWRENVDGKYWFPSYASSDDELVFDNGNVVKMKVRLKYTNYAVGRSEVRILDDDEVTPPVQPTPSPTPKKP
jgi:outer membrane lipoprotein-sorting protein